MIHSVSDRLRLNSTVLYLAAVHFIVDGYGNIFAPLLPLLIPEARPCRSPPPAR